MCIYIEGTTIGLTNGIDNGSCWVFGVQGSGHCTLFRDSEEKPPTNLGPAQELALVGAMLIGGLPCRGDVWLSVQVAASFCVACSALSYSV